MHTKEYRKAQNDISRLRKIVEQPRIGEIVVSRTDRVVLSIGMVDAVFEDESFSVLSTWYTMPVDIGKPCKIGSKWEQARPGMYEAYAPHFGGDNAGIWYHTGKHVSAQEWKELSMDASTEDICKKIGIPYKI